MEQIAWKVYWRGKHIDTVFFAADWDLLYIRDSLVTHDGYPSDIVVVQT